MKNILILGATSAIAQETAKLFAAEGANFFLVARHPDRLAAVAQDLKVRGAAKVETQAIDLNRLEQHATLLQSATKALGSFDLVLMAHGTLPDQHACEQDVAKTMEAIQTNTLGPISLLTHIANLFESQQHGCLAVISSVAGDRGRQSNYVYGMAKGGLSIFLQGLRNRLHRSGIQVLTIKPGFVDTPMTQHLPKNALFASPQQVAQGIYRAIVKGKDIVYVPSYWRWITWVVKSIPEGIFKRLSL